MCMNLLFCSGETRNIPDSAALFMPNRLPVLGVLAKPGLQNRVLCLKAVKQLLVW